MVDDVDYVVDQAKKETKDYVRLAVLECPHPSPDDWRSLVCGMCEACRIPPGQLEDVRAMHALGSGPRMPAGHWLWKELDLDKSE